LFVHFLSVGETVGWQSPLQGKQRITSATVSAFFRHTRERGLTASSRIVILRLAFITRTELCRENLFS